MPERDPCLARVFLRGRFKLPKVDEELFLSEISRYHEARRLPSGRRNELMIWTDTIAGRIRTTVVGALMAAPGVLLILIRVWTVFGIALIAVGMALVLWAWLHKTRSEFPEGFPRRPSPRDERRYKREEELRKMLNDPERRDELDRLFLEYTKGKAPIGVSQIQTILNHEFGERDSDNHG